MIGPNNYLNIEAKLNAELRTVPGYEPWMRFYIEPREGSDNYDVQCISRSDHTARATRTDAEVRAIYRIAKRRVLPDDIFT